jgi:glucose-6-phosphate 1-dehydrogenase
MIRHMLIFGANGDLSLRYLLPALARLGEVGKLPKGFEISAIGRAERDDGAFRAFVAESLDDYATDVSTGARRELVEKIRYHRADAADPEGLGAVLGDSGEPVVAYLALPPAVFAPTIEGLRAVGLPVGSRIVVEKPFGEDLASARKLNRLLGEAFPEEDVFRIDHFLGLQTVQNLLGLRFANRVFEPLWNREHVERVEIVWEETLALEGRAGYYDGAGALKDMIQNHLLQLLCLVGMEPPVTLGERDLRDRKVGVLRAVRHLSPEEVERATVRARYSAGRIGEREIPAYAEEEGVSAERETETFAEVTLAIDNWRWSGVPFVLRTGKALARDRAEIAVHFRQVPHLAFGQRAEPVPNVLRFLMDSDRILLRTNLNGPGDIFDFEQADLGADLAPPDLPAYGRLLVGILEGDPTLSIRADEAEESWRIVEPILEGWRKDTVPLLEYPAGSQGPKVRE